MGLAALVDFLAVFFVVEAVLPETTAFLVDFLAFCGSGVSGLVAAFFVADFLAAAFFFVSLAGFLSGAPASLRMAKTDLLLGELGPKFASLGIDKCFLVLNSRPV